MRTPRPPAPPIDPQDLDRLRRLLEAADWIFAKTMPQNPHEYTLRKRWARDEDFCWAVQIIRTHGYRTKFNNAWYTQFDVNGHTCWSMGWPVNYPDGTACTILINRKVLDANPPLDPPIPLVDRRPRLRKRKPGLP